MSELSMPTTTTAKKKNDDTQFSGANYLPLLIIFLSSFLISNFLPYLLTLLHFLSPLLITTFLVFLFTSYKAFIEKPAPIPINDKEEEHHEVYSIFFEAASQFDHEKKQQDQESQELVDKFLISTEDHRNPPSSEKTTLEEEDEKELFLEKEVKEIDAYIKEEPEIDATLKDVVVSDKECVSRSLLQENKSSKVVVNEEYEKMMSMRSVGSYGSMRVEKEWKRTLACKLFEERHNHNGNAGGQGDEEGMDLLWEAYDEDNNSSSAANHVKGEKKMKIKKKLEKKRSVGSTKSSRYKDMGAVQDDDDEEDEDDDDEEEEDRMMSGKICCLQALKFSAGKVNLGMGRPSIGRISKAFRGIGWLHHVSSKKGYSRH